MLAKKVAQLNGDEHEEIGRRLACQLGEKVFHSRGNAQGRKASLGFVSAGHGERVACWTQCAHWRNSGCDRARRDVRKWRKQHARVVAVIHREVAVTEKGYPWGVGAERER